ncbi:MAG TPA: TIGR02281 family clan AA aspartic protease [Rhodospirillales bacterium]
MAAKRPIPWLTLAAGGLVALLIAYLAFRFPEVLEGREEKARLINGVLLLGFLVGSAFLHRRASPGHAVRHVAAWTGIAVVLFAGYSYHHDLAAIKDRMIGELLPHAGRRAGPGAVAIRADASGHFVVEATVDGVAIRFLVDTGASDVVLSPRDAALLGFDVGRLSFTRQLQTANGIVQGAPVRLGSVAVGPIAVDDVRATVNGAPMQQSLLGMSFLERLAGYEVSRRTLILRR